MGVKEILKSFRTGNYFVIDGVFVKYLKARMPERRVKVHVSASDFVDQFVARHFLISLLKATQSTG